jgi:hypothetical protein
MNNINDPLQQSQIPIINGVLRKKDEKGEWVPRWFETKGVTLTSFDMNDKDEKGAMKKIRSALNLLQVSEIKVFPANCFEKEEDKDPESGFFTFELNSKVYTLRANSDAEAKRWVKQLNGLRQEGLSAFLKEHCFSDDKQIINSNRNKLCMQETSETFFKKNYKQKFGSNSIADDDVPAGSFCCGFF